MNVLLVWNGPADGAERAILARREVALLQHLAAQGVRASVALCGDDAGLADDLRDAGIDTHIVPVPLPPASATLRSLPRAARQLRALIAAMKPDLVEATEAMPAIATGLAAWRRRATRVVLYRRQHGGGRVRLLLASRLAALLTDRTVVSCEAMRRVAARSDLTPADRIEIATPGTIDPRPVSACDIRAARRELGIGDCAHVIGAISRLRHEKGLDVLIRALDDVQMDVHLLIAGTGPEEPLLRELASRSRAAVHFLGHRDDVALWLNVADVVAIPSRRESFGRLTLEAMAAGRPVVATRVGGLPEAIVDGETGVIVPPGDERALAAALRTLLADRELARQRGEAARERFRARYTMAHMATARRAAWERSLAAAGAR
jgi:glycosyltransferase involved in cell wall biosynthesis